MATTLERITKLMVGTLDLPHDILKPEATFGDVLGLDELDCLNLTMSIEEEFGLGLPDDTIDDETTIGGLVELVDRLVRS